MVLTLKNHMIGYFVPLIQNFDNFQPNVLLSVGLFIFFLIFERSITEALGISKNIKTLNSSGESNTNSVAGFEESNLVQMIVSYQGKNDDFVFFTLIVINCGNFNPSHWMFPRIAYIIHDFRLDCQKLACV